MALSAVLARARSALLIVRAAFTFFCSGVRFPQLATTRLCVWLAPLIAQLNSPTLAPPIFSTVDSSATVYVPNPGR